MITVYSRPVKSREECYVALLLMAGDLNALLNLSSEAVVFLAKSWCMSSREEDAPLRHNYFEIFDRICEMEGKKR
jgi:hypothetical protein